MKIRKITKGEFDAVMKLPENQTIHWNPEEYKIIRINTDEGVIEFEKVRE